jgi:DNA-directed RNA polymerase I, II, and III subunit RPABC1
MNNKDAIIKSFKTIMEMLEDRGVDVGGVSKDAGQELLNGFVGNNKILFEVVLDSVKIVYCTSSKVKWADLKKHFEDDIPYKLYICVIKDKMSQNNTKMISALKLNIQVFDIKNLQYNVSKHVLVPKHELVGDEEEVKKLIQNFNLKSKFQLPLILKTDAMAKYLGLKNGDVVKITRVSPTSGEYVMYRCCV